MEDRGAHGAGGAAQESWPPEALETVVSRLRADNEGLRTSLRHRAVIEQAKGVLVARTGCTPDQAFARLIGHSQRVNQKLVRIAAGVVGAAVTAPAPVAADDGFELDALFDPARGDHAEVMREADRRLAGSALDAAGDLDELARIVRQEAAADLAPDAVLLAALEPDGALRLVGGVGFESQVMSAWHRIPPSVDLPLTAAARTHAPVLIGDVSERLEAYPASEKITPAFEAQASVPLRLGGRTVGVIGMSWRDPRVFDEDDERRLVAVADQTVGPLLSLLRVGGDDLPLVAVEAMHTRWFGAVLDTVLAPAFLITPVRDEAGTLVDFEVVRVNRAALGGDGTPERIVGNSILALYPRTAGKQLFGIFRGVLESGSAVHLARVEADEEVDGTPAPGEFELSVAPLGDGLLVSWRSLGA